MRINREVFVQNKNYVFARVLDFLGYFFFRLLNRKRIFQVLQDTQNILLIGADHIGDVLFVTPALRALRTLFPDAKINFVTSKSGVEVLKNNPYVNNIIVFDAPWYRTNNKGLANQFRAIWQIVRKLRTQRFDMAISYNLDGYHREHFIIWAAGIGRRVGYGSKGLGFLLTDVVLRKEKKTIIEHIIDIVYYLGAKDAKSMPEIYYTSLDHRFSEKLLVRLDMSPKSLIVGISPSANHNFLWREEGWKKVCEWIYEKFGAEIVFIGASESYKLVERIRNTLSIESHSLVGKTNILQLAALIKKFDLLITVDSGPRHIAVATGTPVVFLRNGGNLNENFGPYSSYELMVSKEISCAPCGRKNCRFNTFECIRGIDSERVLNAVRSQIKI